MASAGAKIKAADPKKTPPADSHDQPIEEVWGDEAAAVSSSPEEEPTESSQEAHPRESGDAR